MKTRTLLLNMAILIALTAGGMLYERLEHGQSWKLVGLVALVYGCIGAYQMLCAWLYAQGDMTKTDTLVPLLISIGAVLVLGWLLNVTMYVKDGVLTPMQITAIVTVGVPPLLWSMLFFGYVLISREDRGEETLAA